MAAGLGFKTFNTGDVLSAGDTNGYLMQGVLVFADAAARTAAITSPQEGQTSYLKDTDVIQVYSGSAWVTKSGAPSPLTTKGDVYTYSTTDARLAVGANDTVLIADSSTATGLKWGTPSSGGMTLIQTINANAVDTISFTSIPTTYKQLYITFRDVFMNNNSDSVVVRFNNSSAAVYSMFSIEKFTSSIGANVYGDANQVNRVINNTGTAATPKRNLCTGYFLVLDADQSSNHNYEFWSGGSNNSDVATGTMGRGLFYPTTAAAINRIDFIRPDSNLISGTFQLYGVS